jgi:hypothetical protein
METGCSGTIRIYVAIRHAPTRMPSTVQRKVVRRTNERVR